MPLFLSDETELITLAEEIKKGILYYLAKRSVYFKHDIFSFAIEGIEDTFHVTIDAVITIYRL